MMRIYSSVVSWLLIALGVLNILVNVPSLPVFQAVVHIFLGGAGAWTGWRGESRRYILLTSSLFIIFAAIGIFGIRELGNLLLLSVPMILFYLALSLVGVWMYMSEN